LQGAGLLDERRGAPVLLQSQCNETGPNRFVRSFEIVA
jgi:hypothetical protein